MITSTANSQIKNLTKLLQKSKARREMGAFVVEGRKMFLETPDNMMMKVYIAEFLVNQLEDGLHNKDLHNAGLHNGGLRNEGLHNAGLHKSDLRSNNGEPGDIFLDKISDKLKHFQEIGVEIEIVADSVFKSVSDTVAPQGIIAIVKQPKYSIEQFLEADKPLFVILEDLQDPGNLGTIMRTAEGAGVTAVIMNRGTVDIFNPKVIRSTMGAVFRMPFIYVDELAPVIEKLQKNNIKVYAAHLQNSVDYVNPIYIEGTAFLIGNEGNGLSREISDLADSYIKIPMQGKVESLNASVAAALLMYEAYRQRRER